MVRRVAMPFAAAVLALSAGCGGGHEASLTGTVTRNGEPVAHALMNFHNTGRGPMAYAMTDAQGKFSALTGSQSGLMPGTYKLAFDVGPESGVPEKFFNIEHSGLQYEVKAGNNVVDIKLD